MTPNYTWNLELAQKLIHHSRQHKFGQIAEFEM